MTLDYFGHPIRWRKEPDGGDWFLDTNEFNIRVYDYGGGWGFYCRQIGDEAHPLIAMSDAAAKREAVIAVRKHFKKMAEEAEDLYKLFGGKLKMKDVVK